jgi:hypothetical protein
MLHAAYSKTPLSPNLSSTLSKERLAFDSVEDKFSRAEGKTLSVVVLASRIPLTPALSQPAATARQRGERERGKRSQSLRTCDAIKDSGARTPALPLPLGEGRGEGDSSAEFEWCRNWFSKSRLSGPALQTLRCLCACLLLGLPGFTALAASTPNVHFDPAGNTLVNGKPFFPIGIFTYALDRLIMPEVKKQNFNTVTLLTENHDPTQLDWVQKEGLMAICPPEPAWLRVGTNHPALLAWYLSDEPEGHGHTPASLREKYLALKTLDPNHPVTLDHFMWEALDNYKAACDFTMTSVYPLLAKEPAPITHVGLFIDRARSLHNPNWPHWPFIQIFGGENCENGKWKQPEPAEVRCMVYNALVHRANGIFYFSYWPKAPKTWASVGVLNRELQRLTPWLVAPGTELETKSSLPEIQVRAKSIENGKAGLVLVNSTSDQPRYVSISIPQLPAGELRGLFDAHTFQPVTNRFTEKLEPYDTRAYVWGTALSSH